MFTIYQELSQDHGKDLSNIAHWCDEHFLELNIVKTKQMNIDLNGFYQSFIENLLSSPCVWWFRSLFVRDRTSLTSTVNVCSDVTDVQHRDLASLL